jgi:leader peptidase (prepilin peptidase) / N-methyltransferase
VTVAAEAPEPQGYEAPAADAEQQLSPRASLATAFLATLVGFVLLARHGIGARGLVDAGVAAVLVVLSAIDVDRRIIPNRIVLPAAAAVLVAQVALFPDRWLEWVLAALAAGLFFGVAHFLYPAGLGMGDVKLAVLLGAALGLDVVPALFVGSFAAGLFGLALVLRHGTSARKQAIPFGPFMAFGAILLLFSG